MGYIIPSTIISDGRKEYHGQDENRAKLALSNLKISLSSPSLYKIYTTKFKVISIKPAVPSECGDYEAIIYGYTYFGVHFQTWRVGPKGCPELIE